MEGSHQKGANWYRCQYVYKRGLAAAEAAGHPKVLGIKEDVILGAVREFMAERLFGPERLQPLSDELAASANGETSTNDADRQRLEAEQKKIEAAMRRQALRLEEHDDPKHPVVKLAKERIEELSAKAEAVAASISYDKPSRKLELSASISSDLLDEPETVVATGKRSQGCEIAGAGFEPATFGL
jgi:site-specific DNA recombinase